jgi:L-threonylcarbamoyladenylate synthase
MLYGDVPVISLGDRLKPETIAANLFKAFRDFDDIGIEVILAEAINNQGIGLAVMNRMKKAAGYNIIKV